MDITLARRNLRTILFAFISRFSKYWLKSKTRYLSILQNYEQAPTLMGEELGQIYKIGPSKDYKVVCSNPTEIKFLFLI